MALRWVNLLLGWSDFFGAGPAVCDTFALAMIAPSPGRLWLGSVGGDEPPIGPLLFRLFLLDFRQIFIKQLLGDVAHVTVLNHGLHLDSLD